MKTLKCHIGFQIGAELPLKAHVVITTSKLAGAPLACSQYGGNTITKHTDLKTHIDNFPGGVSKPHTKAIKSLCFVEPLRNSLLSP